MTVKEDMNTDTEDRTHWEGCHTAHLDCAILMIVTLEAERDLYIRINESFKMALSPTPGHVNYVEWAKECRAAHAEHAKVIAERDALLGRVNGYQASRNWAIDTLAAALKIEPEKVRAVEYYARRAAECLAAAEAERDQLQAALDWALRHVRLSGDAEEFAMRYNAARGKA